MAQTLLPVPGAVQIDSGVWREMEIPSLPTQSPFVFFSCLRFFAPSTLSECLEQIISPKSVTSVILSPPHLRIPRGNHFNQSDQDSLRGRRKKGEGEGEGEKHESLSLFPYPLPLSTPATQARSGETFNHELFRLSVSPDPSDCPCVFDWVRHRMDAEGYSRTLVKLPTLSVSCKCRLLIHKQYIRLY